MTNCPACHQAIPHDAHFCGYCGFHLVPISQDAHRRLSQVLQSLTSEEVNLLSKTKTSSVGDEAMGKAGKERPQLEVIEDFAPQRAELESRGIGEGAAQNSSQLPSPVSPPSAGKRREPDLSPAPKAKFSPEELEEQKQRRFQRFPLKIEVGYASEHNFYTGFMENLSNGGLFVATHSVASIGDSLELTFSVPGLERSCTAICKVRWVREYNPSAPDTVPGMGLQFSKLDSDARAAIELFIRHREPIFFDDE